MDSRFSGIITYIDTQLSKNYVRSLPPIPHPKGWFRANGSHQFVQPDRLLLPIMAEASSKAAATEIGFSLLFALTTGQDIAIFLESFDPVDYICHCLNQVEIKTDADEKSMRTALYHAGVAHSILATAVQGEVIETCAHIQALLQGEMPTFKQVKQSLLGQTEAFQAADNIRRVRVLVQAHLEKLHADSRYPNFFSYTTQI